MNNPERFLMLYVEGSGSPTVKYDSGSHMEMDNCKAEAQRLAKTTGRKVFVLKAIKSFEFTEFKEVNLCDNHVFIEDLPF